MAKPPLEHTRLEIAVANARRVAMLQSIHQLIEVGCSDSFGEPERHEKRETKRIDKKPTPILSPTCAGIQTHYVPITGAFCDQIMHVTTCCELKHHENLQGRTQERCKGNGQAQAVNPRRLRSTHTFVRDTSTS